MKTYYVIRTGWNAANQCTLGTRRYPENQFESNRHMLVGIVEATSEEEAIGKVNVTVYNNQRIWAVTNPRSVKGLTAAIRNHESCTF